MMKMIVVWRKQIINAADDAVVSKGRHHAHKHTRAPSTLYTCGWVGSSLFVHESSQCGVVVAAVLADTVVVLAAHAHIHICKKFVASKSGPKQQAAASDSIARLKERYSIIQLLSHVVFGGYVQHTHTFDTLLLKTIPRP